MSRVCNRLVWRAAGPVVSVVVKGLCGTVTLHSVSCVWSHTLLIVMSILEPPTVDTKHHIVTLCFCCELLSRSLDTKLELIAFNYMANANRCWFWHGGASVGHNPPFRLRFKRLHPEGLSIKSGDPIIMYLWRPIVNNCGMFGWGERHHSWNDWECCMIIKGLSKACLEKK